MSYAIGSYGFIRWEGGPPQLVRQHVRLFTKIGQPGISGQLTGAHGDPFDVELWAAFPNQALAILSENDYRFTVGAAPQTVLYNNINYFTTFVHKYLVLNVSTTSFKRHPLLIGFGYSYPGGWLLKSRWTLIPVVT